MILSAICVLSLFSGLGVRAISGSATAQLYTNSTSVGACGIVPASVSTTNYFVSVPEGYFDPSVTNPNNDPLCAQFLQITSSATGATVNAMIVDNHTWVTATGGQVLMLNQAALATLGLVNGSGMFINNNLQVTFTSVSPNKTAVVEILSSQPVGSVPYSVLVYAGDISTLPGITTYVVITLPTGAKFAAHVQGTHNTPGKIKISAPINTDLGVFAGTFVGWRVTYQ